MKPATFLAPRASYTHATLDSQLTHARDMMRRAGVPGLRLTRTCDEDLTLARMIEAADPFNARPMLHIQLDHAVRYATGEIS